ncbi:hypothetical protein [Acidithiobacillus sp.]|jgi:hypothetical protein|uniref:hypothetical protein n=1 Tax=Acidithiobacillus sp. TaxID=1872118 RepID=UPI0025C5D60F|nr:hypothetical protein [Acidithiobacillus sp.]MCK9188693.1 hypothetical protein [Acidithiobacillus sp.]MCK9359765.1 hypothetical protein [Acidithiobacillus sp.]
MAKKAVSASTIDPDAPEKETVAHYLVARRESLERYGDYIAQAKNWRIAAVASIAVMMTDTSILLRRGLLLEYITLGWNVVGTAIVIAAAIAAHAVALAGFGLDSLVEIGASVVVVWHLRGIHKGRELRFVQSQSLFSLLPSISLRCLRTLRLARQGDIMGQHNPLRWK